MLTMFRLVLTLTLLTVVIGLLPMLRRALSPRLRVGDRVRLSGGYEHEPKWLGARNAIDGEVLRFVARGGSKESAIVKLSTTLSADGISYDHVALDLRFKGAHWGKREVVHVEVLDQLPDLNQQSNVRGKWVESHASYEVLA